MENRREFHNYYLEQQKKAIKLTIFQFLKILGIKKGSTTAFYTTNMGGMVSIEILC